MSVSIAVLKILSSYPEGRASQAALKADLAMLSSREFFARMRALAMRVGPINIFSEKLATRDPHGWQITQAGRDFLERLEGLGEPQVAEPTRPELRIVVSDKPAPRARRIQSAPFKAPRRHSAIRHG